MKVTAVMKGVEEIKPAFGRLRAAAQAKNLVTAALAGALVFLNGIKTRAPKKTRNLARSFHNEVVKESADYVEVATGSDVEYALIHERGGVIRPKNAKYLAIPLTGAAKAAVSPRNFSGELKPRMRKDRSAGALVDAAGTAHFALVKSVTIPARPYARPTFDMDQAAAIAEVENALRTLLGRAAR